MNDTPSTLTTRTIGEAENALRALLLRTLAGTELDYHRWVALKLVSEAKPPLSLSEALQELQDALKIREGDAEDVVRSLRGGDILDMAEQSLTMAFLVLLERLSPAERAVFLLREVFGYGYQEIAETINKTPANCRQLAVRARRHIQDGQPRFESSIEKRWALADRFFAAIQHGDTDGLASLLVEDVGVYADRGGKGSAIPEPIHGRHEAAQILTDLGRRLIAQQISLMPAEVNGQPGAITKDSDGQALSAISLDIADEHIQAVRAVTNPDKLAHVPST